MSFQKLSTLILIAAAALALTSCKDDDTASASPSLGGMLKFNSETFVKPGQLLKMTPHGAIHPDGKELGYHWKVTPGMKTADTTRLETGLGPDGKPSDGSFSYRFNDSLATYTVTCAAFAKGYTSSYSTAYITIVQPGLNGSITGTGIKEDDPNIEFQGNDYYYVSHNGLDWMRNNLANSSYGAPYENASIVSDIFGRFYSYEEAMKACPEGWRLPTDKEWAELASSINGKEAKGEHETISDIAAEFMADAKMNLETMWEYWPEVGEITNKSGISIIPSGYANLGNQEEGKYPFASFKGIYEYAIFWTADQVTDEEGMAYYRYLVCDQPDMFIGKGDMKTFGANVRCVRESE